MTVLQSLRSFESLKRPLIDPLSILSKMLVHVRKSFHEINIRKFLNTIVVTLKCEQSHVHAAVPHKGILFFVIAFGATGWATIADCMFEISMPWCARQKRESTIGSFLHCTPFLVSAKHFSMFTGAGGQLFAGTAVLPLVAWASLFRSLRLRYIVRLADAPKILRRHVRVPSASCPYVLNSWRSSGDMGVGRPKFIQS